MEQLFQEGALDVYLEQVIMKKGRPGVVVNVLTTPLLADTLTETLLSETSTLGVRRFAVQRKCMKRRVILRETRYGPVRFKITEKGEVPEYEDVRRIAHERKKPLIEVLRELSSSR